MRTHSLTKRIVIADDHQLFADACKTLLEPEFLVVGTVCDGRMLAGAVAELMPDIILLDIYMPRLNGLDAGEQVKKKYPSIKLIFLTMTLAPDIAAEAFRRGASGFVPKQSAGTELLMAMHKVARGGSYLSTLLDKETVIMRMLIPTRLGWEAMLENPPAGWVVGTVESAAEQLAALRESGVKRVMCQHLVHEDLDAVALIGRELAPRVA